MTGVAVAAKHEYIPATMTSGTNDNARALVGLVLGLAASASVTPFIPVPFVDDYVHARLLRRVTRKVFEHGGLAVDDALAKAMVDGYVREGESGLGAKAVVAAARFIVRKVAVVLDVKKSHDVFGEAIVYAFALDAALRFDAVDAGDERRAASVGAAIRRATDNVGSAAIDLVARAGRDALRAGAGADARSRLGRVDDAIGSELSALRARVEEQMRRELPQPDTHLPRSAGAAHSR